MAIVTRNQTNIRNNSVRGCAIIGTVALLAKAVERFARQQVPAGYGSKSEVVGKLCEKLARVGAASSSKATSVATVLGLIAILSRLSVQAFPAEQDKLEQLPDVWFSEILRLLPEEAMASALDTYPENKYVRKVAKLVILQRRIARLTSLKRVVDDMFWGYTSNPIQWMLIPNAAIALLTPGITGVIKVLLKRPEKMRAALAKSSLHAILVLNISTIISGFIYKRLSNRFTRIEIYLHIDAIVCTALIVSVGIINGIRK